MQEWHREMRTLVCCSWEYKVTQPLLKMFWQFLVVNHSVRILAKDEPENIVQSQSPITEDHILFYSVYTKNVQSTGKGRRASAPRTAAVGRKESGCSWGWGFFWDEWKYQHRLWSRSRNLMTLTAPGLHPWCRAFLVKDVAPQLMTVMISWYILYLKWYKIVQFKYVQFMYLLHPIKLFLKSLTVSI